MKQRRVGESGLVVSELGLGTMTFGAETPPAEAHTQLNSFREAGGTFVDTANVYADGRSESIIGEWLAANRSQEMVIATKGRFGSGVAAGAGRRALQLAVEGSLRRLRVDTIDLYFVHGWDDRVPVEETVDVLDDLVGAGSIRYVGWSNTSGWQLQRIIDAAPDRSRPIAFQPQYNLLDRAIEWELLPACLANGLSMTPWSPLGGGWLTGKYDRNRRPTGATRLGEDPDRGVEAYDARNTDRVWTIVDTAVEIARGHDVPPGQVAIAWLLARPAIASVLLGARTLDQLTQNLGSMELELTGEEITRLTEVSAPGIPPYPYGMLVEHCGVTVWDELGTSG
jgi:aryl-alcohol dehydrogenase-like predicted oxidoreductase